MARKYLYEALRIATDIQSDPDTLIALGYWSMLLVRDDDLPAKDSNQTGWKEQAIEVLALALNHPANFQIHRDEAARLMAEMEAELPPEVAAAAIRRGQARDLRATAEEVLAELEAMLARDGS